MQTCPLWLFVRAPKWATPDREKQSQVEIVCWATGWPCPVAHDFTTAHQLATEAIQNHNSAEWKVTYITDFWSHLQIAENLIIKFASIKHSAKKEIPGTSLVVQWLRLHTPNVDDPSSTRGQGTKSLTLQLKIPRAAK